MTARFNLFKDSESTTQGHIDITVVTQGHKLCFYYKTASDKQSDSKCFIDYKTQSEYQSDIEELIDTNTARKKHSDI